jgi:hypothetical protein
VTVLELFLFGSLLSRGQVTAADPGAKIGAQSQRDDQQSPDSRGNDQMVYPFQGVTS